MKVTGAHQFSFRTFKGPIVGVVRHTCDNPPCVNPAHLLDGSYSDNNRDAYDRGRMPVGEKHPNAKLTDAQVTEIRRRVAAGEKQAVMVREFSTSPMTVSRLVRGLSRP